MRIQIAMLFIFPPVLCFAAPKDLPALMKESQVARKSLAKETSLEKKIKKFKEFESSLNATIKDYRKESPTEGGSAEEKVMKFSYSLEPISELTSKKIVKDDCAKTKGNIELEEQSGKPEGSSLSKDAIEALKWVEILCK